MKYYKLILIALVLSSCDVSTLSKSEEITLEKIKVNIHISQDTKKVNYLKVKLTDGKKQIINKNIKVLLNNMPLELYVKNNLYYTKTSYYTASNFAKNNFYYFELILPNETKHSLAFIKPKTENETVIFNIPDSLAVNKDFVIRWKQLNTPHQIEIIKDDEAKHQVIKNRIEYGFIVKPLKKLTKKAGKYTIPKAYIKDSLTTAKYFDIVLSRKEYGLINSSLLKNSEITYHHSIEKKIHLKNDF